MAQQTSKRGGIKLRRSTKHKNMYEAQRLRTERNKSRRHLKRITKRDAWRLRGIKKNGAPVAGALT